MIHRHLIKNVAKRGLYTASPRVFPSLPVPKRRSCLSPRAQDSVFRGTAAGVPRASKRVAVQSNRGVPDGQGGLVYIKIYILLARLNKPVIGREGTMEGRARWLHPPARDGCSADGRFPPRPPPPPPAVLVARRRKIRFFPRARNVRRDREARVPPPATNIIAQYRNLRAAAAVRDDRQCVHGQPAARQNVCDRRSRRRSFALESSFVAYRNAKRVLAVTQ